MLQYRLLAASVNIYIYIYIYKDKVGRLLVYVRGLQHQAVSRVQERQQVPSAGFFFRRSVCNIEFVGGVLGKLLLR